MSKCKNVITVIHLKDTVREMFSCVILLCNVHVERHLRMKVIHTSKWRDQQQDWLTMEDKNEIIKKFLEVRDAPTQTKYIEKKNELFELTEGLLVKPVNFFNEEDHFYSDEETVTFRTYYENKWEPMAHMWVYAHRKNLPIDNINDTNAVENEFANMKMCIKQEFVDRKPTLQELIPTLKKIFDKSYEDRIIESENKRKVYYHKDPEYRKALAAASWDLNAFGLTIFRNAVENLDQKRASLSLITEVEDGIETEKVRDKYGKKREGYVGKYPTTENSCTCSDFQRNCLCIHILYWRENKGLPPYQKSMFPNSFHSGIQKTANTVTKVPRLKPGPPKKKDNPSYYGISKQDTDKNKSKPHSNSKYEKCRQISASLNDSICEYEPEQFSKIIKAFKGFEAMMRDGFPGKILQLLQNPSAYKITKLSTDAGANPSRETSITSDYVSMEESNASMDSSRNGSKKSNASMDSSLNGSIESNASMSSSLNGSMKSLTTFGDLQHNQYNQFVSRSPLDMTSTMFRPNHKSTPKYEGASAPSSHKRLSLKSRRKRLANKFH